MSRILSPGKKLLAVCFAAILLHSGCADSYEPPNKLASAPAGERKSQLIIGGSDSNLPALQKVAEVFASRNPDINVKFTDNVQSSGGVRGVAEGKVNIGLVSRPMDPQERKLGLRYVPYAKLHVMFALHPTVNVNSLTEEQISAIYTGKIRNWRELGGEDARIVVLTRDRNSSSILLLEERLKGFSYSRQAPDAIILRSVEEMNEAIASIENSIGWTDSSLIAITKPKVKVIKLDGKAPTLGDNGDYPLTKEMAFVLKPSLSDLEQSFVDYVMGPEGSQILRENGCIPVKS